MLAAEFYEIASESLHKMAEAMGSCDAESVNREKSNLRNAATNIGARRIYEMCSGVEIRMAGSFTIRNEIGMKELWDELECVKGELQLWLYERNVTIKCGERVNNRAKLTDSSLHDCRG